MLDGIFDSIQNLINGSGVRPAILAELSDDPDCLLFAVLAIAKKYEPLLLLPIAFGMILANLPLAGMMGMPTNEMIAIPVDELIQATGKTLDEIRQTFSADQINDVLNACIPRTRTVTRLCGRRCRIRCFPSGTSLPKTAVCCTISIKASNWASTRR